MVTVLWKTLLGFMTEKEATEYVTRQGIQYSDDELAAVKSQIKKAQEYVAALKPTPDEPSEVHDAPTRWSEYLRGIQSESLFAEHYAVARGWQFGLVDPMKLVTFQTSLNLEYADFLEKLVPPLGDERAIVGFCLPSNKAKPLEPLLVNFNPNTNTFNVVTDNLDYRILGNVQGQDPESGRRFFGFAFGGGLPQISVAEYKGRLLLKNGYHRAYVLAKAGHKEIPVVLVRVGNYADTGAQREGFFSVDTVMGHKPPRLQDLFTPAAVDVKRLKLKVIANFHGEVQAVPV